MAAGRSCGELIVYTIPGPLTGDVIYVTEDGRQHREMPRYGKFAPVKRPGVR